MRKQTNFNPDLLKEELNRFKLLNEYSFNNGPRENDKAFPHDKLILGMDELSEEDENQNTDDAANDVANELGIEEPTDNAPATDDMGGDDMGGDDMGFGAEPTDNTPEEEPAIEEPASDDVEVDVTELVKGSEEAKMAADKASQNSELLMQKITDLESRISSMDAVSDKISKLEKEFIERNPTQTEKLKLQSVRSGPYTQDLSSYWATKHGEYDVLDNDEKEDEYTLTKKDVDDSYSEADTKQSFSVKDEDYIEEDY
jgi:hypothetical protein